jgi:hypothetical protein
MERERLVHPMFLKKENETDQAYFLRAYDYFNDNLSSVVSHNHEIEKDSPFPTILLDDDSPTLIDDQETIQENTNPTILTLAVSFKRKRTFFCLPFFYSCAPSTNTS